MLSEAVQRWPEAAKSIPREAVRLLLEDASRADVVTALPLEERFEWMAEWLRWAADTPDREPNDWGEC